MQVRCEETVSIPEGAEGKLSEEVAEMELSENREIEVKQGKEEEEEMQRCWKERMRMHHHHHHHYGHPLLRLHHGHRPHPHPHPHHHGHRPHPHPHHHGPHPHLHHKEKKWEKLEKKRMKMCGEKKGLEGLNSKLVGTMKHKLEKIDWKIESLQEKKLFISRRIKEIEEEEEKNKKKNETPLTTDAA